MAAPSRYGQGALVAVSGQFNRVSDGALIDPDVVKFNYAVDAGTKTVLTYGVDGALVRDSLGKYHVNLDTTGKPGVWTSRFWATGNGQAAPEPDWVFVVDSSVIA